MAGGTSFKRAMLVQASGTRDDFQTSDSCRTAMITDLLLFPGQSACLSILLTEQLHKSYQRGHPFRLIDVCDMA
jgi:hypothetical protein